jgi:hypothetical protein
MREGMGKSKAQFLHILDEPHPNFSHEKLGKWARVVGMLRIFNHVRG